MTTSPQPPSDPQVFDTVIIGAGQAGPSLAGVLDGRGERVALVQDGPFGGTCLNDGCRPTKAMRASARAAHVARTAGRFGVVVDGPVRVDLAAAVARKDRMIDTWRAASTEHFVHHPTITYLVGRGRLAGTLDDGTHRVTVGDRTLVARRVILNTGARSTPPPIEGLGDVPWMSHHEILDLTVLPDHLLVLGGSYIGLEFGQMFRRFGADVTIVEHGPRLVGREDPEVSAAITEVLTGEGVGVVTSRTVSRVSPNSSGGIEAVLDDGSTITASHVLVATGRTPNSDDLGLDTVGVETDDHGHVRVDDVYRTTVAGIYAVGDVNGRGAFTHTSFQDHEILADHLSGGARTVAGRVSTYGLFTDPPLGRFGLTATEAGRQGLDHTVVKFPMSRVTRAVLDDEPEGIAILVADRTSGRLLGAAVLGHQGDEVVQTLSLLTHAGGTVHDLATWLPVHPTVAEYLPTIAAGLAPPEA
ncbi:MAG: mercuric reductase [Acidimicrobiales bacterium]